MLHNKYKKKLKVNFSVKFQAVKEIGIRNKGQHFSVMNKIILKSKLSKLHR